MTEENVRLTADLVAIAHVGGEPHVLLIRRAHDPYEGHWALPGGHVDEGETAADAAIRELHEETGISVHAVEEIGVWHAPGRDPRGRYVTVAYRAEVPEAIPPKAADDAAEARWWPVGVALEMGMAFDHGAILIAACTRRWWTRSREGCARPGRTSTEGVDHPGNLGIVNSGLD